MSRMDLSSVVDKYQVNDRRGILGKVFWVCDKLTYDELIHLIIFVFVKYGTMLKIKCYLDQLETGLKW